MTDSPEQTPLTASSESEPREPDLIEVDKKPKVPLEGPAPAEVPATGRTMANVARQFRTIT